jgi:site-specific DNA-cytosine methylase
LDYTGPDTRLFSKSNLSPTDAPSSRNIGQTSRDTTTSAPSTDDHGAEALTLFAVDALVKTSRLPDGAPDSPERNPDCSTNSRALQTTLLAPADTFYSKTSRDSCPATVAEISPSFSRRWPNSGFVTSRGESWTADTSESPNGGDAFSSLAGVLLADVAPRFYLSRKAAAGILRRATKRGRVLPEALRTALHTLAHSQPPPNDSRGTPKTSSWRDLSRPQTDDEPVATWNGRIGSKISETERSPQTLDAPTENRSLSVRRLTPTECERLQGFPDGWTIRRRTDQDTPPSGTP